MDPNPNDRLKSEHNTELVPQHLQYSSSTSHSVNHFMWLSQVEVSLKSVGSQLQLSFWRVLTVSPSSRMSLWKWCVLLVGRWFGAQWCPVIAVRRSIEFLGQDFFPQSFLWVCWTSPPMCLRTSQLFNYSVEQRHGKSFRKQLQSSFKSPAR